MLDEYGLSIDYIILGLIIAIMVLFILMISLIVSNRRLKKRYNKFMTGSDGENLEEKFLEKFEKLDAVTEENKIIKVAMKKINEIHKTSFTKIGMVHYDAFEETTGKLSFVIALLNDGNNGVIINSVYSTRSGCYVYAKELINGESYKVLTDEEKIALQEAIKGNEIN